MPEATPLRPSVIRFAIACGLCALASAAFAQRAGAVACSINKVSAADPGTALFAPGSYEFDATLTPATLTRANTFATLQDGGSNDAAGNPPGPRTKPDSWDEWGALFVGAGGDSNLANLYWQPNNNACTLEDSGRELVFPVVTSHGLLLVQRKLFVPAAGSLAGGRILNTILNSGTVPVTTSVQVGDTLTASNDGDLGSDANTAVRSSSNGNATLEPADLWAVTSDHGAGVNTDLALAHVFDGPGAADRIDFATLTGIAPTTTHQDNLAYRWDDVTIQPGETVAYMSFEVQQGVTSADAATENAAAQAQAVAHQTASAAQLSQGMSADEIAAVRNWKLDATAPVLSGLKSAHKTWAVDGKGSAEVQATKRKKAKKGTTFKYSASEFSRVVFKIERLTTGRKVGKKCKRKTRSNRKRRRCTRATKVGSFAAFATQGQNSKPFSGKIGTKRLRAGKHRATLVASDNYNASKPARTSFKVVRR